MQNTREVQTVTRLRVSVSDRLTLWVATRTGCSRNELNRLMDSSIAFMPLAYTATAAAIFAAAGIPSPGAAW